MAVHTPFFKPLVLMCLLAHSVSFGQTRPYHQITDEDRSIVAQTRAIEKEAMSLVGSDWLEKAKTIDENALNQAKALQEELRERSPFVQHAKHSEQQAQSDSAYDTLIFVSYSLDEQTLNDVLTAASGEPRTVVVMRGIPEGMRIWDGVRNLQQMAAQKDPIPNVQLDPTLFQKYDVQVVPTIVVLSEPPEPKPVEPIANPLDPSFSDSIQPKSERVDPPVVPRTVLGRVQGLSDPMWLRREIKAGAGGDRGIRGPVEEIHERDLIEVMKERVMQIDWEQKKEQTKARYWHGQRFINLPRAPKAETRHIDASVVATKDIRTSEGEFVARAGDRVNPLQTRPWTQAIVVFDPMDKKQMELLTSKVSVLQSDPSLANVVLIATQFDKDLGWDSYKSVTDTFNAPVYQLTPDVKSRFELRYTPSIITANDTHFIVQELAVSLQDDPPIEALP